MPRMRRCCANKPVDCDQPVVGGSFPPLSVQERQSFININIILIILRLRLFLPRSLICFECSQLLVHRTQLRLRRTHLFRQALHLEPRRLQPDRQLRCEMVNRRIHTHAPAVYAYSCGRGSVPRARPRVPSPLVHIPRPFLHTYVF